MRGLLPSQIITCALHPERGAIRNKTKGRIFGTSLCPMRAVPITALSSLSTQICSSGSRCVINSRIFFAINILLWGGLTFGEETKTLFSYHYETTLSKHTQT